MNSASARGSRRTALLLALLLAFACAALAITWGLRLLSSPQQVPSDAQLIDALSPDQATQQAARLFGAAPVGAASAAQSAPSRFRLYGVIAGGSTGSALIGIDGKPPRAVGVGDAVSPGVFLRGTGYKLVWIERDGVRQELKMDPQGGHGGGIGRPSFTPHLPQFNPPALAPPGIAPANIAPQHTDNEG